MNLVALMYNDRQTALEARSECSQMAAEHLLSLEDAVVVFKNEKGDVTLDQTVNLMAASAANGGFWGLLLGMIFSIPFGGVILPFVTAAFGAGAGAFSGALADYGIDDRLMKKAGFALEEGKAILFLLGRAEAPDKVLERLAKFNGELVQSNFPSEVDEKLKEVLKNLESKKA